MLFPLIDVRVAVSGQVLRSNTTRDIMQSVRRSVRDVLLEFDFVLCCNKDRERSLLEWLSSCGICHGEDIQKVVCAAWLPGAGRIHAEDLQFVDMVAEVRWHPSGRAWDPCLLRLTGSEGGEFAVRGLLPTATGKEAAA